MVFTTKTKGFNTKATKDVKESRETCPDPFDTKPSELGDDTLKTVHQIRVILPGKHICVILAAVLLLCLLNLKTVATMTSELQSTEPSTYFDITVIVQTSNPALVQHTQITVQEFWKIGIKAELVLVGWDILIPRMFENVGFTTYNAGGFDIGFIGWTGSVVDPATLWQFYHSAGINKTAGGLNYYPIDNSTLDDLLDNIQTESDVLARKELVRQALDIIVWEEHPTTGIYQAVTSYALDAEVRSFDPTRWSMGEPNLQEMYYNSSGQSQFRFASPSRFIDLNPVFSNSYYDSLIYSPVYSSLFELDENLQYRPVFASGPPIPIGSNDTIADVVTPSADSPYFGMTTWGDSPNINTSLYAANVTAADKSMFLINLKEGIPWQPGYGYNLGEPGYITADNLIWSLSYILNDEIPQQNLAISQSIWGNNHTKAIEKINDTMVKINLRGPLGNGRFADYYNGLAITPYPQHILDPTFDASPYNGSVGVTPDGTTIANYTDHRDYAFNTGDKPTIQAGPYYMENWSESNSTALLKKFDSWGGEGANSLWNEAPYNNTNRIETYEVTIIDIKSTAELALANEEIDGIDYNFQMGKDVAYLESKPNIQVISFVDAGVQSMGYNTRHPRLSDRFVRLAISHIVPREKIVEYILGGLSVVNEVVGLTITNPYFPDEEAWQTIGLPESFNKDGLEFQGHISYDLEKAWTLMEYAGYDMDPLRDAVEIAEWGLLPEDIVSWKFRKLEYPIDPETGKEPSERLLMQIGYEGVWLDVPIHEGSLISIEVLAIDKSYHTLRGHKSVDGFQGVNTTLPNPYIVSVNKNWTSYGNGGTIERDDYNTFIVLFVIDRKDEGTYYDYRLEYDKTDGTLRRLEKKGMLYNEWINLELVRTDLLDEDDDENPFSFQLDLNSPVAIVVALFGAFVCGIGSAQLLKINRGLA